MCPDPQSYLMKCCDCGLVHEAQFGVVRYASETEREDCEKVDDPNLQAVFRMRRSEQWTPKDTAYRPGGLAQPEQEPVAWMDREGDLYKMPEIKNWAPPHTMLYTAPPQRKPLTKQEIWKIHDLCIPPTEGYVSPVEFTRAIEQAHGIKGKA